MNEPLEDSSARAYLVELVETSPLAPPFPDAADESSGPPPKLQETRRGVSVAAFTFIAIVGIGASALWFAAAGRPAGLGSPVGVGNEQVVDTLSNEAAVVADDGTVLRGQLWRGDDVGIIVAPGYGDDAIDAHQVATSLARSGHTVFFYNLRGQRPSGGLVGGSDLTSDLRAVVADLRTRGVESIHIVGYRQSATAAIVLAAEPSGLEGVAAVFAYETYEKLDAATAAAASTAPLLLIGAEGSNGGASAAHALAAANGTTEPYIISARPPSALSSDHFSPKVVRAVLQFVEG